MGELHGSRDVRRELNLCWPPIPPQRLLRDLYAQPERLAEAASSLTRDERALLRRDRSAPWTTADVPLLDEAAELLGEDETSDAGVDAVRAEVDRRAEVEYAKQVQDTFGGAGFGTAEQLAGRYAAGRSSASVAEQADTDRTWAFGHVVVDEAPGTVADGVATADAPLPVAVVHDRRRRGADRVRRGHERVGRCARTARRRPLAAGRADRQLPHARNR